MTNHQSYQYDKLIDESSSLEFKIAKRKQLIKEIYVGIEKDERKKQDIINKWLNLMC